MSAFGTKRTLRRLERAGGRDDNWSSGTPQPPRQMGPSPCKRCSLVLGASTMDSGLESQHLHRSLSGRHVSLRAGCGSWRLCFRDRRRCGLALYPHTAADRGLDHGSRPCRAGLFGLEVTACVELARLAPFIVGAAFGVPLGVFVLAHADPHYLRLGIGVVLVLFSLYGLLRPAIKPMKDAAYRPTWEWAFSMACLAARPVSPGLSRHLVATARLGQGSAARGLSAGGRCHFCDECGLARRTRLDFTRRDVAVCRRVARAARRHLAWTEVLRQAR